MTARIELIGRDDTTYPSARNDQLGQQTAWYDPAGNVCGVSPQVRAAARFWRRAICAVALVSGVLLLVAMLARHVVAHFGGGVL